MEIRRSDRVIRAALLLGFLANCGPGGNPSTDASTDRGSAGDGATMGADADAGTSALDSGFVNGDAIAADTGSPRVDASTNDSGGLGPRAFRRGVNGGYHGPGIDRREA